MAAVPPDPTRRNERSRRAILDASISLVAEVGYDNVSIEAIARRACVGKQTIYRWWPSKGAVVLEAAIHTLDAVVDYPDTGDVVADLRVQLGRILEVIGTTGFGPAYRGLVAASQSDPALMQELFEQVVEPNVTAFERRMTAAKENGELRPDADTSTLRDLLYGVVEYRMLHGMPIELEHVDAVLALTFDGVR